MIRTRPSKECLQKYSVIPIVWENLENLIADFNTDNTLLDIVPQHTIDMLFGAFIFGVICAMNRTSIFNKGLHAEHSN